MSTSSSAAIKHALNEKELFEDGDPYDFSNTSSITSNNIQSNNDNNNRNNNERGTGSISSTHNATTATSTVSTTTTPTLTNSNNNNNTNINISGSAADRNAVVMALFGPTVGPCLGDFPTSYVRVNGRLYASTKAILFYSNLFGFERRLCLNLSEITEIEAFRSTSIRISTVDCEEYIFRKFQDRDRVLQLLLDIKKAATDPHYQIQPLTVVYSATNGDGQQQLHDNINTNNNNNETIIPLRPHSNTNPDEVPLDDSSLYTATTPVSRPRARSAPFLKRQQSESSDVLSTSQHNESNSVLLKRKSTEDLSQRKASDGSESIFDDIQMKASWEAAKVPLEDVALEPVSLSCTLEQFFELFFHQEAKHPISKYQAEQIGDVDIQVSSWNVKTNNNNNSITQEQPEIIIQTREINFMHPVKNPIGPSKAKTCRQQNLRQFLGYGMCMENTTVVEGIPAADCFQMEDRWIIEAISAETIQFSVTFRVNFTKRTMLKSLIQKSVRNETKIWFQGYVGYLQRVLEANNIDNSNNNDNNNYDNGDLMVSSAKGIQQSSTDVITHHSYRETNQSVSKEGYFIIIIILSLILLTLLFQVWSMRTLLNNIQTEMILLREQNNQLLSSITKN